MKLLGPTSRPRLNEIFAFVYLVAGVLVFLALITYNPLDPSSNTAADTAVPTNTVGAFGAVLADLLLQAVGLAAYTIPALILALGWKWVRSAAIPSPWIKILGGLLLATATCTGLGMISHWRPIAGTLPAGGLLGLLAAQAVVARFNLVGGAMVTALVWVIALYMVSTFEVAMLGRWFAGPIAWVRGIGDRFAAWKQKQTELSQARAVAKAEKRAEAERLAEQADQLRREEQVAQQARLAEEEARAAEEAGPDVSIVDPLTGRAEVMSAVAARPMASAAAAGVGVARASTAVRKAADTPPWEEEVDEDDALDDIPIRALELPKVQEMVGPKVDEKSAPIAATAAAVVGARGRQIFKMPPTSLLQEPAARTAWDSQELKETASQIKSKFEEFNVRGNITQINPGPVVTTFEFKPEAGVKYSRITTLTEDLCLGLQAESILIERIPGKPTVGIEVPNTKREVISLRQILESDEFKESGSPLTIALGKDINGRIKVATLETMPHLLVAGSTGAGKSVMLNSLIMSVLYKSTPEQVRMIMVDPKRLEFGLYEGIPHLLTPVITEAKKATNALRNAVLEMERRLKLLASIGVRNIDQYNKKVQQLRSTPRSLFGDETNDEELEVLPYILILIDELADLMMLERQNVEESVMRLAQMARAVGMHLVLATQRPSVDVITGVIKANFPSRISFRVATRVDSRTVLDVMGAEHLLGKGDMLFLPPGSSRLVRVHGSYVSENETADVVEFWKRQAAPDYDQSFLIAPPSEEDDTSDAEADGPEDAMYQEAVRVVCEMGKASTSTLQRRLRLGYGRAARILDMMQRDGIIGPPDGSRPRDVLKTPDWLHEVADQLR
jgi:DNA segregation ATPase FtsK/SpoIIIE, S-DNA-T family